MSPCYPIILVLSEKGNLKQLLGQRPCVYNNGLIFRILKFVGLSQETIFHVNHKNSNRAFGYCLNKIFLFNKNWKTHKHLNPRGVFRTLSNIYDGDFVNILNDFYTRLKSALTRDIVSPHLGLLKAFVNSCFRQSFCFYVTDAFNTLISFFLLFKIRLRSGKN